MKKRDHRPTSKEGEVFIAPHKETHKDKILAGLKKLKVGGTQEELAAVTGMRTDQVWKRMIDLQKDKKIFDTGITRKLKSGLNGIVWQLKGEKVSEEVPVIETTKKKKQIPLVNNPLFQI